MSRVSEIQRKRIEMASLNSDWITIEFISLSKHWNNGKYSRFVVEVDWKEFVG